MSIRHSLKGRTSLSFANFNSEEEEEEEEIAVIAAGKSAPGLATAQFFWNEGAHILVFRRNLSSVNGGNTHWVALTCRFGAKLAICGLRPVLAKRELQSWALAMEENSR